VLFNLRNGEGTNETTGKKTFNTDVGIRAETGDGVVRSNLWEKSMSDKELITTMNREQLNTPRILTAEELDMVFGGLNLATCTGEGPEDSQGSPLVSLQRLGSNVSLNFIKLISPGNGDNQ
jgi:hypothetical protein